MALWHRARSEHEESALCATLVRMTEKRLSTSPLALAMLERTFLRPARKPTGTDPSLREAMRHTLLDSVKTPKGKDLARLDFTEAAFMALDDALAEVDPVPLHQDAKLQLAGSIATAFVHGRIAKRSPVDIDRVERKLVRIVLDALPMSTATAKSLASSVLWTLDAFHRDTCSQCTLRCVDRTRAHFVEPFFADTHPVLDGTESPF